MKNVLPPGEAPHDPAIIGIDALAFALNQVRTQLGWIEKHRTSYEARRVTDHENAEREMQFLAHSTEAARIHLDRLAELLLSGYSIDRSKRLPRDLELFKEATSAHGIDC